MSRVSTNTVSLAYAVEASLGVLPGTPDAPLWKRLEPNTITAFGPTIATVSRNPISKDRQRKKGTITDLDSSVEFEADVTMDAVLDFLPGFVFAVFAGPEGFGAHDTNQVTAATGGATDAYTVSAGGALPAGRLIFARGFAIPANNGLKVVNTGSSATSLIVTTDLENETDPPENARIDVAGVVGASGDLQINASGNLISTALDFTTLDLTPGQFIWVGGTLEANRFAQDVSNGVNRGWARVVSVEANLVVLDKKLTTYVADNGSGKTIHLYFGRFLRNVPVDDDDFLEQSLHFEAAYPDLDDVGTPAYEYAIGNYCNQVSINLALADKATMSFGFIGIDTLPPTTTRAEDADEALDPLQTVAFNTSADIARLRIADTDEEGLTTYFKSLTITLNNNVSPEKVLGVLGAAFMNIGNFEVDLEAQVLFTSPDIPAAIRNNETLSMDFSMRNDDGALYFDIPAMTIGGGDKEFPENETVLINTPGMAFEDPLLGTSLGISFLPYVPTA